ncbi:hypothetical protein OH76DRAFT_336430 [Lentinus brumalis]|uniref:Uncharacterized protein n=1 Tax=Lentinus brumalis TaxID=2498619 RepID=A0A371CJP4_9APHY|nr:hypothetical protein OH76DRAFT_336430 [Polyporus brumalis]
MQDNRGVAPTYTFHLRCLSDLLASPTSLLQRSPCVTPRLSTGLASSRTSRHGAPYPPRHTVSSRASTSMAEDDSPTVGLLLDSTTCLYILSQTTWRRSECKPARRSSTGVQVLGNVVYGALRLPYPRLVVLRQHLYSVCSYRDGGPNSGERSWMSVKGNPSQAWEHVVCDSAQNPKLPLVTSHPHVEITEACPYPARIQGSVRIRKIKVSTE